MVRKARVAVSIAACARGGYLKASMPGHRRSIASLEATSGFVTAHHKFELVQEFVSASKAAQSMADLRQLIDLSSRELGFDYFAIVHHIRFGHPSHDKIRLSNYPLEWLAILREDEDFQEPVLKAAERASSGFLWSRLDELVRLTERQRNYMKEAARHGLADGY